MTVVTGVSGSGKSTLIKRILYPGVGKMLGTVGEATGRHEKIEGAYKKVTQVEFVDQNPIGKSSRSNPVTYVKAYDAIRRARLAAAPLMGRARDKCVRAAVQHRGARRHATTSVVERQCSSGNESTMP